MKKISESKQNVTTKASITPPSPRNSAGPSASDPQPHHHHHHHATFADQTTDQEHTPAAKKSTILRNHASMPDHPAPPSKRKTLTNLVRIVEPPPVLQEPSGPTLPLPAPTYRISSRIIPGNAGARLTTTEALNAVPVTFRATSLAHPSAGATSGPGTGPSTALRLEFMNATMLQMEIEKQQQQLNRMAILRHSMLVQAQIQSGNSTAAQANYRQSTLSTTRDFRDSAAVSSIYIPMEDGSVMERDLFYNPDQHDHTHAPLNFDVPSSNQDMSREKLARTGRSLAYLASMPLASGTKKRLTVLTGEDAEKRKSLRRPTRTAEAEKAIEEWEVLTTVKANELHNVTKYRSRHTGLTVVHAKVDSPEVHGYFVFRHRCTNDWGLPHMLQHMIFLGSKNFPFPGILDQLAVKCYAEGTDAWTEKDHACYILKTAGKEGFLQLLPVYLEHLFCPVLSEAGYLTEVHHVTGDGKDGGVCYLEMKATEHDPLEQANWALMSEIYGPESGYHYNYGGHYKEMRESANIAAVRKFHKQFYHARNCCLIICGDFEPEEIFTVITSFTLGTLQSQTNPNNPAPPIGETNPWKSEPLVEIEEELETVILYPSESEGTSLVKVGMLGAVATHDPTLSAGMDILVAYLIHSHISPVQSDFIGKSLASGVTLTKSGHIQTIYCFNFENVKTEVQEGVGIRLKELLQEEMNGKFDMERMEFIVAHCCQEAMSAMENEAEDTIARAVISDFIYGFDDDPLTFDRRINYFYTLEQFVNQPPSFWLRMLKTLIDSNWVCVYAQPSKEIGEEYLHDELERQEQLMEKMGTAGCKKAAARLRAAIKIQGKVPPDEMLNFIKTPSINSIGFLGIERHDNPAWAGNTLCNLYLDDINSNYVYLTVLMDTSELTLEEKKYLVLFAEALLEAPYVDNSQRFYTYEQMIAGLSKDVLKYETFFGIDWDPVKGGNRFSCGNYSNLFCIRFQMEMKRVKEGFEWMQILLWNTKWQPDRLKNIATRLANEVTILLDHGPAMTAAMNGESLYNMNSNVKAMSLVRQQVFLQRLGSELPKSFKRVAKMLEAIRMVILRPENTTVHVATRLEKMEFYLTDKPEIRDAISQLLRRTFDYTGWHWGYPTKRLANEPDSKWMKNMDCIQKCRTEKILRMHSDEGAYLLQVSPCIREFNCPEYPILLATLHYFCQHEGPFHKGIRNTGYALHYSMRLNPEEGLIYFEIVGANDLVSAYTEAFQIIIAHLEEKKKSSTKKSEEVGEVIVEEEQTTAVWSPELLASAKSSAIFDLIEKENTPKSLALGSLLGYYREVPTNFNRFVMHRISSVNLGEMKAMTKKYLQPLFIKTTTCSVAAPSDQVPGIIQGLMDNCGKRLSLLPPVHQSEMAMYMK